MVSSLRYALRSALAVIDPCILNVAMYSKMCGLHLNAIFFLIRNIGDLLKGKNGCPTVPAEIHLRDISPSGIMQGTKVNSKGKEVPHGTRLYSIAATRYGDTFDGKTTSLCVRRAEYWCPEMNAYDPAKKGICSNFLCDAKPGDEITMTGAWPPQASIRSRVGRDVHNFSK